MNTRTTQPRLSFTSGTTSRRAQFSPLRSRATSKGPRNRVQSPLAPQASDAVPRADTLTPATPAVVERWWDPHLVDRLQPPLTRYRD